MAFIDLSLIGFFIFIDRTLIFDRKESDEIKRGINRFDLEEESSSSDDASNGDEAAEEIEEDELDIDIAQVNAVTNHATDCVVSAG